MVLADDTFAVKDGCVIVIISLQLNESKPERVQVLISDPCVFNRDKNPFLKIRIKYELRKIMRWLIKKIFSFKYLVKEKNVKKYRNVTKS